MVTYIDDQRVSGYSAENAWRAKRQVTSRQQRLGIQDAPRKTRPPMCLTAGAWCGMIFLKWIWGIFCWLTPLAASRRFKEARNVGQTLSQAKWEKGKRYAQDLGKCFLSTDRPLVDRKQLESMVGFWNHVAMTYPELRPFLRGLYHTLHQHLPSDEGVSELEKEDQAELLGEAIKLAREQGNKGSEDDREGDLEEIQLVEVHSSSEITGIPPPGQVRAVARMAGDVEALVKLFDLPHPPVVTVRSSTIMTVTYGFGDASGLGKGSTIEDYGNGAVPVPSVEGIRYRIGVWEADEAQESSNYREFTNVVEAMEEDREAGRLKDCEVFFFTDNSTVETALFKGTSTSPTLLKLVIRFHILQAKYQVKVHVIHCAGTRICLLYTSDAADE